MAKHLTIPRVSVVMSVYNNEEYLRAAVDSILAQTFPDFEFIIINDGSTDDSLKILKSYDDPRIVLVSRANKGLAPSLNEGLRLARGEFVARMDGDDISLPTRLAKQVQFLDQHPVVGLVGTNYTTIDHVTSQPVATTHVFTHPDDLKVALVLSNQFGHGPAVWRRAVQDKVGLYDEKVGVEDYDMWVRISHVASVANLEEPLYQWRRNPTGVTSTKNDQQVRETYVVRDREFKRFLAHRREYRVFAFHPDSWYYVHRKAVQFRDLAYLYRKHGRLAAALLMQAAAVLLEPTQLHNYKRLVLLVLKDRFNRHWQYEYL